MSRRSSQGFALAMVLALAAPVANAQDEEASGGFSWNAALTSEYLYRGISQSDDHPALQFDAGYGFASGFYVGAWGSNVDFGDSTDAEIDTYVGWNGDLADGVNFDVQINRYNYVNQPPDVDYAYNELISKLTFNERYGVTLGYTDDYLAMGVNSTYLAVDGSWDVGSGVNLTAGAAYTRNSGDLASYADYSVGLNRDFGPINVALQYVGTNGRAEELFGEDASENTFVLTLSTGN